MRILLALLISTHILYASFWQECEGIVTVEKLSTVGTTVKATLKVHEHTFKCTGHSETLYSVTSRDVPLDYVAGMTPKLHKHYRARYKYSDSALPYRLNTKKIHKTPSSPKNWKLLKRVHFVPSKPKEHEE